MGKDLIEGGQLTIKEDQVSRSPVADTLVTRYNVISNSDLT